MVLKKSELQIKEEKLEPKKTKIEQVSASGVANSAIGSGLVELAKNIFIAEENKPATKGDILKLGARLKRYHQIKNLSTNSMGQFPYFDLHTNTLVYLGNRLQLKVKILSFALFKQSISPLFRKGDKSKSNKSNTKC